jgi:hypothetical protein
MKDIKTMETLALAMVRKDQAAARVIAMLYVALTREAWMPGPTASEAIDAANDWYYSTYGYEGGDAASVAIPKMIRGKV